MKKIVLVPDSFKGTMSSEEICSIMEKAIHGVYPKAEVVSIPVADGGEGSTQAFLTACGGEKRIVSVAGPFFEKMDAFYGVIDDGKTAVIEMAACAGLPLVGDEKNPLCTTTYGVGELMRHAADNGCTKIILGLGGSATNDGGCGAAAALGIRFFSKEGTEFTPTGGTLEEIDRIDVTGLIPQIKACEIITMCDIDNPLCGPQGAAYVFAPQKGADTPTVERLDRGLAHLAQMIRRDLQKDICDLPGAGAAGGMGGGMVAFFDSMLQMGIETVLDTTGFDQQLEGCTLVITGEGKIDTQSVRGKVVAGVADRAGAHSVPVFAVVGDIGDGVAEMYEKGVSGIFSINRVAVPYKEAKLRAKNDLYLTIDNLMKTLKVFGI